MPHMRSRLAAVTAALAMSLSSGAVSSPAFADQRETAKNPVATGYGGAVSTVDPEASAAAIEVLRKGGNAADAAVAAAATPGGTEPYSAGIGGGGYFVFYNAKTRQVGTIDGRETAPAAMPHDAFIDPATGQPYRFTPELVTSGVSVGVPGSLATWQRALDRWGTMSLGRTFRPAIHVARHGFVVDPTFRQQTLENKVRFDAFRSTRRLFLPGGDAPQVGSVFRNPALATTYREIARRGISFLYDGRLGREISRVVHHPPKTASTTLPVPTGFLTPSDLRHYTTVDRRPTHVGYRGYDVYGMAPSSSGGSTVGEALNIMERFDLAGMTAADALHHYLDASALAFADRGAYVGDPAYVDVPLRGLLSDRFARQRACLIPDGTALVTPVKAGDPSSPGSGCGTSQPGSTAPDTENLNTTNLTVADRWGNIVEYTLTIEQTGGSGIVVPGRGFLLNNELTDFTAVYDDADPNRIEPGKRPRSSMSPTLVLHRNGRPLLAVGSPGGSTIITTVLQILVNRLDLGMTLPQAIAAPRATQRNTEDDLAEPAFLRRYGHALKRLGHHVDKYQDIFTGTTEIGAATGIEFGPGGLLTVAAEPRRRGGGAAT